MFPLRPTGPPGTPGMNGRGPSGPLPRAPAYAVPFGSIGSTGATGWPPWNPPDSGWAAVGSAVNCGTDGGCAGRGWDGRDWPGRDCAMPGSPSGKRPGTSPDGACACAGFGPAVTAPRVG